MKRKPFIAGNWKMNKNIKQAIELVNALKRELVDVDQADIAVCPVFTAIAETKEILMDSNIKIGGQNLFWEKEGAFTGEVSAGMLKDAGCEYVIIGHSERRKYFNETNEDINKKIKAALKEELLPIVCVGETLEERENDRAFEVVENHIQGAFIDIDKSDAIKITVAYEPVWAIGTGKTATPQQAQQIHHFIRTLLSKIYDEEISQSIRIQYGGSVKPDNIKELMQQADIDGALVGGASLEADSFSKIVKGSF